MIWLYVSVGNNMVMIPMMVVMVMMLKSIRKLCPGLKGCKDVKGNYHKLGDSYIGESNTIRKIFDETIFDKYIQISNASNFFFRSGRL